ncbi:hypothetical protein PR202_gb22882 [Eleusine coracana subsp. coracana]|uniref:Mediator of RNA polymerase II transcription subunit 25 n=1 Tax=Eleusine coracana subsp. coracana TaxID=191504 RepID=A0AAV5FGX3_ELECO|nr:hypothetical protein PR202_gb22882 [Eleusine coracana subsp. coracana]
MGLPNMGATPIQVHMSNMISSGMTSAPSVMSSVAGSGQPIGTQQMVQSTSLGSFGSNTSIVSSNSNIAVSSSLANIQSSMGMGQSMPPIAQGGLMSGSQSGQGGISGNQNVMSGLGTTTMSSAPAMMPTPGMAQQAGVNSLGVTNSAAMNMPIGQHPNAQQPQPSKYVKIWEGTLSGQRQGQPVFICKLETSFSRLSLKPQSPPPAMDSILVQSPSFHDPELELHKHVVKDCTRTLVCCAYFSAARARTKGERGPLCAVPEFEARRWERGGGGRGAARARGGREEEGRIGVVRPDEGGEVCPCRRREEGRRAGGGRGAQRPEEGEGRHVPEEGGRRKGREGRRGRIRVARLAADWPETMQIVRLIAQEHMNNKQYVGKADFLVFRTLNQHGFLGKLQEKKLCAVIQLPSQTLLLSVADKAGPNSAASNATTATSTTHAYAAARPPASTAAAATDSTAATPSSTDAAAAPSSTDAATAAAATSATDAAAAAAATSATDAAAATASATNAANATAVAATATSNTQQMQQIQQQQQQQMQQMQHQQQHQQMQQMQQQQQQPQQLQQQPQMVGTGMGQQFMQGHNRAVQMMQGKMAPQGPGSMPGGGFLP